MRFINRFGGETIRKRRCYQYEGEAGGYYPLDEKLGIALCGGGYSPLLSYLQASYGGSEAFGEASRRLSEAIGFRISATAIQNNTEKIGERMSDCPYKVIAQEKREESCDVMLIEMHVTTSPQIRERSGWSLELMGWKRTGIFRRCEWLRAP